MSSHQLDATHYAPTSVPTDDQLVARAVGLAPTLHGNAHVTEAGRRPSAANLDGLRAAGLLRLTTPRSRAGWEVSVRTQVEVGIALARACPSTAWVAGIYNGVKPMTLMLSEAALDEFYAVGPDVLVCSVASVHGEAIRTDTGVRLSGTWAAASGCEDADWALLGVALPGAAGDPPAAATVLVPVRDLRVKDTWHVAGLRGTGSQSLVAEGVLVPEHRIITAAVAAKAGAGGFPAALKIGAALNLLAPVIGAAVGALDTVRETLESGRGIMASVYRDTTDSPSARIWLGEADRLISRAVRQVVAVADEADAALAGDPLTLQERSALRMEMVAAIENARSAMSKLLDLNGTGGFAQSNALQRFWRDMETGSRHVQFNPFLTREDYGRLLAGIQSPVSLLL
ncbi:alkylation response protein AidB-like acyl-CoA dehydrogenase [Streptomyces sp. 3330]|uniref:acyl-CoA dehydrogenase n=1 Tax=Streptomyces sp. 3330 TaxID=2817755 RepID=UPI00285D44B0|nr:acyl-CoA dehydrogenase [Streptomyces sp. 3330]MDR6974330.1 alkylation response protein AidB-like acyl-CoA dehydrogenase [Streptomyces sp. 3330]